MRNVLQKKIVLKLSLIFFIHLNLTENTKKMCDVVLNNEIEQDETCFFIFTFHTPVINE